RITLLCTAAPYDVRASAIAGDVPVLLRATSQSRTFDTHATTGTSGQVAFTHTSAEQTFTLDAYGELEPAVTSTVTAETPGCSVTDQSTTLVAKERVAGWLELFPATRNNASAI